MNKKLLFIFALSMLVTNTTSAQITAKRIIDPSKYNLESNEEKLKKINLKLEIVDNDRNSKDFKIPNNEDVLIRVLASVSDKRIIALGNNINQFVQFKPLLLGQNDVPLPYPPSSSEKIGQAYREFERRKNPDSIVASSGPSVFISPDQENTISLINIADWYGKLPPGYYKVVVGFSFDGSNNIIYSSPISFEIY